MSYKREFEVQLHEKLFLAGIIWEGSYDERRKGYRMFFDEAANLLLSKDEFDSAMGLWIRTFGPKGDWEEDLLYVIDRVLGLPSCPQKWRDSRNIPLEEKLEDIEFYTYYNKMKDYMEEIVNKYRDLYEIKLDYRIKQGSYTRGGLEKGIQIILNNPIY